MKVSSLNVHMRCWQKLTYPLLCYFRYRRNLRIFDNLLSYNNTSNYLKPWKDYVLTVYF